MQGADYSGGRPTGAALLAAGFGVALRYVGLGAAGKRLTAAEYKNLRAAGQVVLTVAELGTTDSWGTSTDDDYARGVANAKVALADCRACGIPESEIFVFAASDSHAAAQWQITDTVKYVTGFRDVLTLPRTGHYGFVETQTAVHNAGVASGYWRCGSQPAAADKAWVNYWQRNAAPTTRIVSNVVCDVNDEYHPILNGAHDMAGFDNTDAGVLFDFGVVANTQLPNAGQPGGPPINYIRLSNTMKADPIAILRDIQAKQVAPEQISAAIDAAVAAHVKVTIAITPEATS